MALVVALLPLVLAAPAAATLAAALDPDGLPPVGHAAADGAQAVARFLGAEKVADLARPVSGRPSTSAVPSIARRAAGKCTSGRASAGEIATGEVDDASGDVVEAWTGPQVAWKMARGGHGAFGGKVLDSVPVWFGLCAVFLVGLADLRRPLSLRNLDLLVVALVLGVALVLQPR